MAFDMSTGNLLLTNDGGIDMRTNPQSPGGKWVGVQGDIGVMEFYFAQWDNRLGRWIAGAQDNFVQVMPPNTTNIMGSRGVASGDGTRTVIDNVHCPARLIGSCQFMTDLTVVSGYPNKIVEFPIVPTHFKNYTAFLHYFVSAFTLNTQNPDMFVFWADSSWDNTIISSFWQSTVPTTEEIPVIKAIVQLPTTHGIFDIVSGGYTNGVSNPNLLYAINNTCFFNVQGSQVIITPLPTTFATPVIWSQYTADGVRLLGPISHGITAWMSVSPANSNTIAITGWPVNMNNGAETVWLSNDGANTWTDITGNLYVATGTIARIRPSGILIIEFQTQGYNAVLVGTVHGVFISWTDSPSIGIWSRIGLFSDMPLVMVLGLSYNPYSDTLVAATMGRGVYILQNAKTSLLMQRSQQQLGTCNVQGPFSPTSSAIYFPAQQSC